MEIFANIPRNEAVEVSVFFAVLIIIIWMWMYFSTKLDIILMRARYKAWRKAGWTPDAKPHTQFGWFFWAVNLATILALIWLFVSLYRAQGSSTPLYILVFLAVVLPGEFIMRRAYRRFEKEIRRK
jgi:hypothetical protein